jgi:hypothetical protein
MNCLASFFSRKIRPNPQLLRVMSNFHQGPSKAMMTLTILLKSSMFDLECYLSNPDQVPVLSANSARESTIFFSRHNTL